MQDVERVAAPHLSVPSWPLAGDIQSFLKLLAKDNRKYGKIVVNVSSHNTELCHSEVTEINLESVSSFAMGATAVFSGSLPNLTSHNMYSHWLSRW